MIPLAKPFIGDEETAAVSKILQSGMLVQGAEVAKFEQKVASYCERAHAVAVSSGTAALSLALKAIGIRRGDHVLCPDLTWPSPAHAIMDNEAVPVLVDVDPQEWNVTPEAMARARTPQTRAAIVIDQFGNPARAQQITAVLPGVTIIVDAACSIGSCLDSKPCGAFGTISCLSLHPRKVITTGEGGLCLTDDDDLSQKIRELRNHGQASAGHFVRASGNYRMTEMSAALGIVQLSRLDQIVEERQQLARRYQENLPSFRTQKSCPNARFNFQTFGLLLPKNTPSGKRDKVVDALRAEGVGSSRLSYALHRLNPLLPYERMAKAAGRTLEVSAEIDDVGIAIPLYPGLTHTYQDRVISALNKVIKSLG